MAMHIEYGQFEQCGHIPYARWGTGDKTMLILSGGPGNMVIPGMGTRMMTTPFDAFAEEYTLYYLGRRQGQPAGYTTKDMSDDYARLIEGQFGGRVDVVAGMSYGGMIAQHLAVDYPTHFRRIIVLMSAHRAGEEGGKIDYAFAQYMCEGKKRKAASLIMTALYPEGFVRACMRTFAWLLGPVIFPGSGDTFRSDIMIEAEAELNHDTEARLADLTVPVLLINGTADRYFPLPIVEQTARLMGEHVILKLYGGRGHGNLMEDERFIPDVRAFIKEGE
jgi:pimeloyl-ACP methyl ester carboxylesterase